MRRRGCLAVQGRAAVIDTVFFNGNEHAGTSSTARTFLW